MANFDVTALAAKAEALRALHHGQTPLVLANVWDAASARAVAKAGLPAVATSSGAMARSLGWADGEQTPVDEVFAALARITRAVDLPVTADLEAGYRLSPTELVERMLGAGVVGANLEDTDHAAADAMVPAEDQAARLSAVKEAARAAGVDLVINARVDTFVRASADPLGEAIERGRLYHQAGADCVYPITMAEEKDISAVSESVPGPLNVLLRPGSPSLSRLAELGVARVSMGSGLHQAVMKQFAAALEELHL